MEKPIEKTLKPSSSLDESLSEAQKLHELERPSAPLALRFAGRLLDFIFVYLVVNGLSKIFQAASPFVANPFLLGYLDIFLRLAFLFAYFILVTTEWGGTLGQLLMGVKVIDSETGERLSFQRTCLRLLWLFSTNFLSLLVASVRSDQRGLHDVICNSTVKKVRGRV